MTMLTMLTVAREFTFAFCVCMCVCVHVCAFQYNLSTNVKYLERLELIWALLVRKHN